MSRNVSITAAATVAVLLSIAARAHALLPPDLRPCRKGIAASSGKFVKKKLRAIQRCDEKNIHTANSCPQAELNATVVNLELQLRDAVAGRCANVPQAKLGAGFLDYPGPCNDGTPNDGFTLPDLEACLAASHESAVDRLLDVEYGPMNGLTVATLDCQHAIAKNAQKLVSAELKAIQKCRNAIDKGTLSIPGDLCATADPKTAEAIAKSITKARAAITGGCTAADVQALGTCAEPACTGFCGTCDPSCVADCIVATHGKEVDGTAADFADMIDYEYPAPIPPPAPTCGDQQINRLDEECDGTDAASCPGQCGGPSSPFPCLCLTKPRERVIEHADADLDTGWTGTSHDSGVVEGGSYVVDLYDCDGPGGPDTLCRMGPSCSGAPHPACSNDAQCLAFGLGTCRKERTAVGPHCNLDVQQTCSCTGSASARSKASCPDTVHCPGAGNFCVQQFHGPPLPISAGGIPVCIVNVFTEDVTGTRDLATGTSAFRLRQNSFVQVTGLIAAPCPVCGGFCQGSAGGERDLCTTNADCDTAPHVCVTVPVCSGGPNVDQPCRPDPPFGGSTAIFGNPSVDCPPPINGAGIVDIVFDPDTTGVTSKTPDVQCDNPAFGGKTCAGGSNNGADCTVDSECSGGTCNFQCFCPTGGAVHEQPNACDAACVGGASDAQPCGDDSDCPGGFCHLADCRSDPTAPPTLQPYEGGCTATFDGHCSVSTYQSCTLASDCAPPACARCRSGETCDIVPRNCFINSEITRVGAPSPTDPVTAAVFCIPPTHVGAVDAASGLPGPGALHQPTKVVDTGF